MLRIESRQFTQDHNLYACIQCGKCTGGCPVAVKTTLNPRSLIYKLLVAGNGYDLDACEELWDCTTCATCSSRCPKLVSPMETVIALRSVFIERGRVHPNVKTALESTFRHGNPLTMPREDRAGWASELSIRPFSAGMEYLYFVGCTPSYDPRVQQVSRDLVKLVQHANLDFGFLAEKESCCGSEIRRLGEFGLFEMIEEENQDLFKAIGVSKLFTTSPHCFNAIKNDYSQNDLQVEHYTQLLARTIQNGRLEFSRQFEMTVTFHDPCYLGKHNTIYDEPRQILTRIPGLKLIEMDRSREKSLCCEGGGGRMWLEGSNPGTRLARWRIQEALDTGAQVLATACPFCLLTLEEAAKYMNVEDRLRVMDIAEIAVQAL